MALGSISLDEIRSGALTTPPVIRDSSGNEVGQLCKAWVNFDGTTTPATIIGSFNVTLVTRSATGTYDVTMSANAGITDTKYSLVTGSNGAATTTDSTARTSTQFTIFTRNSAFAATNYAPVCAAVFR